MSKMDFINILGFMSCSFCFGYFIGYIKASGKNS